MRASWRAKLRDHPIKDDRGISLSFCENVLLPGKQNTRTYRNWHASKPSKPHKKRRLQRRTDAIPTGASLRKVVPGTSFPPSKNSYTPRTKRHTIETKEITHSKNKRRLKQTKEPDEQALHSDAAKPGITKSLSSRPSFETSASRSQFSHDSPSKKREREACVQYDSGLSWHASAFPGKVAALIMAFWATIPPQPLRPSCASRSRHTLSMLPLGQKARSQPSS